MKKQANKIIAFLNSIPYDKQLHFLYGEQLFFVFFTVFMVICALFPKSQGNLRVWEIGAIVAVGAIFLGTAKELFDKVMDKKDALVTALGVLVCYAKMVGTLYVVARFAEMFVL